MREEKRPNTLTPSSSKAEFIEEVYKICHESVYRRVEMDFVPRHMHPPQKLSQNASLGALCAYLCRTASIQDGLRTHKRGPVTGKDSWEDKSTRIIDLAEGVMRMRREGSFAVFDAAHRLCDLFEGPGVQDIKDVREKLNATNHIPIRDLFKGDNFPAQDEATWHRWLRSEVELPTLEEVCHDERKCSYCEQVKLAEAFVFKKLDEKGA